MGLFGREPRPVPEQKRLLWSAGLWREATGTPGIERFNALVMVRRLQVKAAWQYGSRTLGVDAEYIGRLGCEPGSMVEHIRANVLLDTTDARPGSQHARPDSLGIAYTNQYDYADSAYPILVVKIWAHEEGARVFERAFDRALAAGHDHLPLWIDDAQRADALPDGDRFNVIQPLSTIRFEQSIVLGPPQ